MKILLITQNATIEKLFKLSAAKRGDEIEIGSVDSIADKDYDVIFIDKELFNEELFNSLKSSFEEAKFVLILNKNDEKIPGFDDFLVKPFLPTDLISLLDNIKDKEHTDVNELDEFDLESFNTDDLEDDFLVSDEDLEKEVEEDEEEEDFIVDDKELDDLLEEDSIEEENLEDEIEEKEDVDDAIVEDEEMIDTEENEDELDKELENIDEKELAEAIGEEIPEENEELKTDEKNLIEEENNLVEEESVEEKTLGSILNINWEELKKAKAKVTITIDFGG